MRFHVSLYGVNVLSRNTDVFGDLGNGCACPVRIGQDCLDNLPGRPWLPWEPVVTVRRKRQPLGATLVSVSDMNLIGWTVNLLQGLKTVKTIPEMEDTIRVPYSLQGRQHDAVLEQGRVPGYDAVINGPLLGATFCV
jgi:hypothetical protein